MGNIFSPTFSDYMIKINLISDDQCLRGLHPLPILYDDNNHYELDYKYIIKGHQLITVIFLIMFIWYIIRVTIVRGYSN